MLEASVAVAGEFGLSGLTFAKVAERLGTSDRMVVYYFPTKADLITATIVRMGGDLQVMLAKAFGAEPRSVDELIATAWPVLASRHADRVFAVLFEAIGLASAGKEPYSVLAPALLDGWATWLEPRVIGSSAKVRRRRALGVMATIDGLLLLRRLLGADAAQAAFEALQLNR